MLFKAGASYRMIQSRVFCQLLSASVSFHQSLADSMPSFISTSPEINQSPPNAPSVAA